jgi:hypothetical protein
MIMTGWMILQHVEIDVEQVEEDEGLGMVIVSEVLPGYHKFGQHAFQVHHVESRLPAHMHFTRVNTRS